MPEGTALETHCARARRACCGRSQAVPEVSDYQVYAGTAAPINFNGLVRQYYLRSGAELGDMQVNLVDKHQRDRQSHEIALAVAADACRRSARRYGASVQVVEVPPGPPVQAPIGGRNLWADLRSAAQPALPKCATCFDDTPGHRRRRRQHRSGGPALCRCDVDRRRQRCSASRKRSRRATLALALARQRRHLCARRARALSRFRCAWSCRSPTRRALSGLLALEVPASQRRAGAAVRSRHRATSRRGTARSITRICCRWST